MPEEGGGGHYDPNQDYTSTLPPDISGGGGGTVSGGQGQTAPVNPASQGSSTSSGSPFKTGKADTRVGSSPGNPGGTYGPSLSDIPANKSADDLKQAEDFIRQQYIDAGYDPKNPQQAMLIDREVRKFHDEYLLLKKTNDKLSPSDALAQLGYIGGSVGPPPSASGTAASAGGFNPPKAPEPTPIPAPSADQLAGIIAHINSQEDPLLAGMTAGMQGTNKAMQGLISQLPPEFQAAAAMQQQADQNLTSTLGTAISQHNSALPMAYYSPKREADLQNQAQKDWFTNQIAQAQLEEENARLRSQAAAKGQGSTYNYGPSYYSTPKNPDATTSTSTSNPFATP